MKIVAVLFVSLSVSGCIAPPLPGGPGYGYGQGYGYGPTYSSQRAYDLNMPNNVPYSINPYNRAYRRYGW